VHAERVAGVVDAEVGERLHQDGGHVGHLELGHAHLEDRQSVEARTRRREVVDSHDLFPPREVGEGAAAARAHFGVREALENKVLDVDAALETVGEGARNPRVGVREVRPSCDECLPVARRRVENHRHSRMGELEAFREPLEEELETFRGEVGCERLVCRAVDAGDGLRGEHLHRRRDGGRRRGGGVAVAGGGGGGGGAQCSRSRATMSARSAPCTLHCSASWPRRERTVVSTTAAAATGAEGAGGATTEMAGLEERELTGRRAEGRRAEAPDREERALAGRWAEECPGRSSEEWGSGERTVQYHVERQSGLG